MTRTTRPQNTADSQRSRGHGSKSDSVRERAVLALLTARSVQQAAAEAGVGEKTLRVWLADDADFQQQYAEARRAAFKTGIARVQGLIGNAVDALEDMLSPETAPAVRLGAARTIAELAIHQDDAETIMDRLDAIERAQEER